MTGGPRDVSAGLVHRRTGSIRARRHPAAVVGVWAWQAALAVTAALPAASLAGAAYGATPRGDAPLWDGGAHALLDFLWHARWGLRTSATAAEIVLAFGIVAGLVPTAGVMCAMAYATPGAGGAERPVGPARSVAFALTTWRPFAALLVAMGLAEVVVLGLGAAAAAAAAQWGNQAMGEARAGQTGAALAAVFALGASGLGVVHDLARATVVRRRVGWLRAAATAARIFVDAPVSLWWSWAWRTLLSIAPVVLVGGLVAPRLGGRGGWALVLLAGAHQAVVLSRAALRVSWLSRALRATGGGDQELATSAR